MARRGFRCAIGSRPRRSAHSRLPLTVHKCLLAAISLRCQPTLGLRTITSRFPRIRLSSGNGRNSRSWTPPRRVWGFSALEQAHRELRELSPCDAGGLAVCPHGDIAFKGLSEHLKERNSRIFRSLGVEDLHDEGPNSRQELAVGVLLTARTLSNEGVYAVHRLSRRPDSARRNSLPHQTQSGWYRGLPMRKPPMATVALCTMILG